MSGISPYSASTTAEEVIQMEMGQLMEDSSLTKDEKVAKVERAQALVKKISSQVPLGRLERNLDDLKKRIETGDKVEMSHPAVRRCKILYKRVIKMIKEMEDTDPFLKEIPQRFLVFRESK